MMRVTKRERGGYRSFYVEEKKLLLLIYAPLKCFCSSKKGNNTSVYSMIQNVKRRKDTTRGLFCKTTNKTNGVCFMLSLQMRLNGCVCVCDSFTPTYISWISWGEVITQGWCGAISYRKKKTIFLLKKSEKLPYQEIKYICYFEIQHKWVMRS